jgi:hypothetical protein
VEEGAEEDQQEALDEPYRSPPQARVPSVVSNQSRVPPARRLSTCQRSDYEPTRATPPLSPRLGLHVKKRKDCQCQARKQGLAWLDGWICLVHAVAC